MSRSCHSKCFHDFHTVAVLAVNVWAYVFAFILKGDCVFPSVGNGCKWRNSLEWTFQTNNVPSLWYRIHWKNDAVSDSNAWSRTVYCKARRPPVLYHVISREKDSVGEVTAMEISCTTNMLVLQNGLMVPISETLALTNNPGRWRGVTWQYLKRDTDFKEVRIFDYYMEDRHLWTVVSATNDTIQALMSFRHKADCGIKGSLNLRQLEFFSEYPLVDIDEVAAAFIKDESRRIGFALPGIPEVKARDRARQKIVSLKRINGNFAKAIEKFKELADHSFVEWKDYGGATGIRYGLQFSTDGRILFTTVLHYWAGWQNLPVADLHEYIVDVKSFQGIKDIVLACGHSVPVKWDEKAVLCKVERLAETADHRRELVRLCSGCTALYEGNKLIAVLCERNESTTEIALLKILRAIGELPSMCIAHEYQ